MKCLNYSRRGPILLNENPQARKLYDRLSKDLEKELAVAVAMCVFRKEKPRDDYWPADRDQPALGEGHSDAQLSYHICRSIHGRIDPYEENFSMEDMMKVFNKKCGEYGFPKMYLSAKPPRDADNSGKYRPRTNVKAHLHAENL